ncbi:mucin-2-like [Bolinopsis microptera]
MESEGGEKAENPLLYQREIEQSGNKTCGRVEEKAELSRRDITLRDATPHRLNAETEIIKSEEGKGPSPIKTSKPFDLYPSLSVSQTAFSDTSSVLSPASSSENYNEPLNLSTDMEFTDSETEARHAVCNISSHSGLNINNSNVTSHTKPKVQLPSFSPQRFPQSMSPLHVSAGYASPATSIHGNQSPTRSFLPDGLSENISAVRVKVRSRHASFSTPPKSPADSQWRLFKVNRDMKEETFDDINGERNFTQSLTLKNVCDAKLNVSDKEDGISQVSSCPSSPRHLGSPVRSLTSPARPPAVSPVRPAILPVNSPARPLRCHGNVEQRLPPHRSTTPSPSPPFSTPPTLPARCVSPNSFTRASSFTLKRKIVEPDCASPPKRPCTMGLGHRSPTVEYRARNHSPAPLSPLAVSSQSAPEGEVVREVPIHLLDKIELMSEHFSANTSDNSSDSSDSPPRNIRLTG